ncbi:MAG: flavodoxin [Gemmatimonadetes bacterium]|nr:MAG: flavodoxin [Gemmatimonadota bacterium]
MKNIALFYGSTTGATEEIAKLIQQMMPNQIALVQNIVDTTPDDIAQWDQLILGVSTWYDGELQDDWLDFFPQLDHIDFKGKKVAIFGLGDCFRFPQFFCDGIGILYEKLIERGAEIIGFYSTKGYKFQKSRAVVNGRFVGLPLDEDTEYHLTEQRIETWIQQIKTEFL